MRRHEMDHALEPDRQLAQRLRRADGERLKNERGSFMAVPFKAPVCRLEESKPRAK